MNVRIVPIRLEANGVIIEITKNNIMINGDDATPKEICHALIDFDQYHDNIAGNINVPADALVVYGASLCVDELG